MRLRRSEFVSWLKAKAHDAIVGKNRDCHGCPIALFYYEASGGCEVVISDPGDGYVIDRGYSTKPLPAWAAWFVFKVDGLEGQITAHRALAVMDEERNGAR